MKTWTQRAHDVNTTSPQRRCDVVFTSWRCIDVEATLYLRHDIASTLRRRCIYVMTLHRRWGDVVFMSWCCIDIEATLYLRHDVASTLMRRCIYVMCLPGIRLYAIPMMRPCDFAKNLPIHLRDQTDRLLLLAKLWHFATPILTLKRSQCHKNLIPIIL